MRIIKRMRRQKAVYWARSNPNKYGTHSYAAPVEIDCRWDGKGEEFRDSQGSTRMSNATVYPDRAMHPGDKLMEGEMESNTSTDPLEETEAFEIQRFDKVPDLKARQFLYIAYL